MCDLLGLSFNTPVTAKFSLDIFQQSGVQNPDGWGVAFYVDGRVQIVKEAAPANDSRLFDFVEQYPQSKTVITHVRRSTRGVRSYLNTHPFYRLLPSVPTNHEYTFAHNGTLLQQENLKLMNFAPIGETDSEHIFCFLLDAIAHREIDKWKDDDFRFIEGLLRNINDGQNTLNCIFSDGEYLFCYSDENDHNNGLRFVKQTQPFGKIELISTEEKLGSIDIRSDSEAATQTGYIISTRILTNEPWTEFKNGEFIVFREGEIVYPVDRASS